MFLLVFQRLLLDFLFDIVYFPIWWYTNGLKRAVLYCAGLWQFANEYMAPGLWLKNIFVPMFGQADWQGRVMSFFMRLMNVFFRGILLFVWTILVFLLFLVWLFIPVLVVWFLVRSL